MRLYHYVLHGYAATSLTKLVREHISGGPSILESYMLIVGPSHSVETCSDGQQTKNHYSRNNFTKDKTV
jgi:hypothetical protein